MESEVDFVVGEVYDFATYAANFIYLGYLGLDGIMIVVGVRDEEIELMRTDKPNARRESMSPQELRYLIAKGWANRVA